MAKSVPKLVCSQDGLGRHVGDPSMAHCLLTPPEYGYIVAQKNYLEIRGDKVFQTRGAHISLQGQALPVDMAGPEVSLILAGNNAGKKVQMKL